MQIVSKEMFASQRRVFCRNKYEKEKRYEYVSLMKWRVQRQYDSSGLPQYIPSNLEMWQTVRSYQVALASITLAQMSRESERERECIVNFPITSYQGRTQLSLHALVSFGTLEKILLNNQVYKGLQYCLRSFHRKVFTDLKLFEYCQFREASVGKEQFSYTVIMLVLISTIQTQALTVTVRPINS